MMRIVYVSPVGVIGGAERCLLNVMASVRAHDPKAEVHLIASTDGPLLDAARDSGVRTHELPMPATMAEMGNSILRRRKRVAAAMQLAGRAMSVLSPTRRYLSDLRRLVQSVRPDVIHSNGLKAHLLTSLAGANDAALVWHIHDFLGARPAMGRALRLAARRAAGTIAISEAVARDIRNVLPKTPVRVVYNGIDVGHFSPGSDDAAQGQRLDRLASLPPATPGTLRVGLVATFAIWKGQDILLKAAEQLFGRPGLPPVRIYIVGGPIYRTPGSQFTESDLRARARALGIADRVGFIGFQQDTRSVYRGLDVVVHASVHPEPFGLTIIEAMACGKPVIISAAGGAAELFTDGVDGIGIKPGSPEALAAAIERLVVSPETRTELGRSAYRTAVRRFSSSRLGGEILAVYDQFRTGR